MRNADSGLDLDDSGSGNDSYFQQSESERQSQRTSNTSTQSGNNSMRIWFDSLKDFREPRIDMFGLESKQINNYEVPGWWWC